MLNSYNNNITDTDKCQEYQEKRIKLFTKLNDKKRQNKTIVEWLQSEGDYDRAQKINECATYIGIVNENSIPKIIKSNFCRQRLCMVCAWRRQAKFVAQMFPVIDSLSRSGYRFIFATLTLRNCSYDNLAYNVDLLMSAFAKLRKRRKVKRSWCGICRSVELTYNHTDNTYHPHIHLLIAVKPEYFCRDDLYITQEQLSLYWAECLGVDYIPVVDIRAVDDTDRATVETLKYSLKPSQYSEGLKAFHYILSGRRLISFTGVFAKVRKDLRLLDFEQCLDDDIDIKEDRKITYDVYRFDASGGLYTFYNTYNLN